MITGEPSGNSGGVSELTASSLAGAAPLAPPGGHAGRPELLVSPQPENPSESARLRRVFREQLDFVWRCVRRFGVPEQHADDATQEVLIVAARKLAQVPEGRERGFLFAIAAHVGANARRSLRRRAETLHEYEREPEPVSGSQEELTEQLRARQLLDDVMGELPEELRAPFILFEIEEWSIQEIAQSLELPIGTVGSRLRSARKAFSDAVRRQRARWDFRRGSTHGA